MSFKKQEKVKLQEFLELLYRYVCVSGNYERLKNEIGLRRAMILKAFLCEYLESSEEDVGTFAENFFKNAPAFEEMMR